MQIDKIVHPALIPFVALSGLIGILVIILGAVFLEGVGLASTIIVGCLLLLGSQIAFWANFFYNRNLKKRLIVKNGNLYWFDFCGYQKTKEFIYSLSSLEDETLELLKDYGASKISEPLYCFVMEIGEVEWHGKKARGLQRDNWLKIEWLRDDISYKLARHELMHYLLSRALPLSTTAKQHEIMRDVLGQREHS